MEISNVEVHGLYRSQKSAGLPKCVNGTPEIPKCINSLGRAVGGSGHDCFLKGITVYATFTADHSWWLQWMRYHFQDIVSSSSKMHTILNSEPIFEDGTDEIIIARWMEIKALCIIKPTPDRFNRLIMSSPMGMMLTADIITNYLQMKTVYSQRKTHKMFAWQKYCGWLETLPDFIELTQRSESC